MCTLDGVRTCSSGGWALDMLPTWLPGGALRLPPGLFGSVVPLNNSLRTHQVARVAVRLYSALAALLRYTQLRASTLGRQNEDVVCPDLLDTRRIWGKDLRLKGLENLSSDQLFFVYYAMDNCQRSDAQAQRRLPWPLGGQERVNGPLRHWAPFAEHFGCRDGQPMVPPKRCSLLEAS
ncbi:hypothetical protein HPB51_002520 [Rhipicephalus microplus]|uniref:Peptidase M13 C-terminal domain-containing protein n=1 Tax=Rhipicephalus microplus TaxID=6941 RepID=A0A9J6DF15_RHIMP|nr:hypothetical protein HPB51_002520 [Rhipicephalus microplus]